MPFTKGQPVDVTWTYTDESQNPPVLVDPATPFFAYRDGNAVWHRDLTPTRVSTGTYTYRVYTDTPATGLDREVWWVAGYTAANDAVIRGSGQTSFVVINPGLL